MEILLKQNLCTTAAYRPVRELIQQERLKDLVSDSISSCYFLIFVKREVKFWHSCWGVYIVNMSSFFPFVGEKAESCRSRKIGRGS